MTESKSQRPVWPTACPPTLCPICFADDRKKGSTENSSRYSSCLAKKREAAPSCRNRFED